MKKRILSATIIVALIAVALTSRMLTPYVFDAIMIICGIVGTIEVVRAYAKRKMYVNENLACTYILVLYLGLIIAIYNKATILQLLLYFVCIIAIYFVLTFIFSILFKDVTREEMLKAGYTKSIFKYSITKALRSIYILIYPTMLFMLIIVLNHLNDFYVATLTDKSTLLSISAFVDFLVIAVFVCATFTDTFAMLIGSKLQGKKLCPNISPNKTVSGAVGGFLMGLIGVLGLYMLYSLNTDFITILNTLEITWVPIILFAVFGPIIAQLGDIVASVIKRKNYIKDFSNLIPGHGGVMDRVDGLIFVGLCAFITGMIIIL